MMHQLTPNDKFMVLASDGVWEFLSNEQVWGLGFRFLSNEQVFLF
jgi:serine/threonine protein phosphatase PrpC